MPVELAESAAGSDVLLGVGDGAGLGEGCASWCSWRVGPAEGVSSSWLQVRSVGLLFTDIRCAAAGSGSSAGKGTVCSASRQLWGRVVPSHDSRRVDALAELLLCWWSDSRGI
jgi:hypothetical protein